MQSQSGVNYQVLIVLGTYVLLQFLAWVACCVAFGAPLFNTSLRNYGSFVGYWDHIDGAMSYGYPAFNTGTNIATDCDGGGKGFIAMMVFAFLLLLPSMALSILRIFGKEDIFPFIQSRLQCVNIELGLIGLGVFFQFLAIVIFGGACFHPIQVSASSIQATGFAYIIVAWFFLIFALLLALYMRRNMPDSASSASSDQHNTAAFIPSDQMNTGAYPEQKDESFSASGGSAAAQSDYQSSSYQQHDI